MIGNLRYPDGIAIIHEQFDMMKISCGCVLKCPLDSSARPKLPIQRFGTRGDEVSIG